MRFESSIVRAALAVTCSLAVACTSAPIVAPLSSERPLVRGATDAAYSVELGRQNWEALKRAREIESTFYQNVGMGGRPRTCLALSGGGMRSAFFSIGVMKALSSELEDLDVISGVSGGSYALAWYFAQQWHRERRDWSPLFDDSEIARLGKESRRYRRLLPDPKRPRSWLAPVEGVIDVASIASNWMGKGVEELQSFTGWGISSYIETGKPTYMRILQAIFLQSPDSEAAPSLVEIRQFIAEEGLPFFVIGASLQALDDHPLKTESLRDRVFEITPAWMGADSVGHKQNDSLAPSFPIRDLVDAVLVSGAALDKSEQAIIAASAGFYDLGEDLPWKGIAADQRYSYIRVADGGFVENLGAFVLIRRLCDRITIVDSEEDPWFEFEGYWKLKQAVRAELGADLYVKAIEDCCARNTPSDGDKELASAHTTHAFRTEAPVMAGTISRFPIADGNDEEDVTISVRYIKLSIDEAVLCGLEDADKDGLTLKYRDGVARYGELIVDYYLASRDREKGCQERFPHLPTWNQFYDETRTRAFVDLGYELARGASGSKWTWQKTR